VLLIGSLEVAALAQTATATPESEEIIRLRDQKTRAELEKDIAVAEKAKRDAEFPKPSTSPLSGETKINDGAVIESDMVSYVSMAYAANDLVKALKNSRTPIGRLAIYSKPDLDLLLNYNVTLNQIELVRQQYCKLLANPDPDRCPDSRMKARSLDSKGFAPLTIAGSLLGAFVDMTALLRTNVTVQGHAIEINEPALVSEVFRAIRSEGGLSGEPELFYPAAFPPNIDINTRSQILGQLEVLYDLKARLAAITQDLEENLKKTKDTAGKIEELEAAIKRITQEQQKSQDELKALVQTAQIYKRRTPFDANLRMQQLRKAIADLNRDHYHAQKDLDAMQDYLKSLQQKQADLMAQLTRDASVSDAKEAVAKLKMLNERFEQFVTTLIKIDAATGINSLTAYIRAENLRQALNGPDGDGYWLQLAVVKAGGNNRIKTNLVTDIFTGGSRISHSGGVIVQYNLYDQNGRSLVSDTLTQYAGYVKSGKIQRLPNPSAVDEVRDQTTGAAKQKQAPRKAIASGSRP
jgi:archaellum component FlaC